MSAADQTQFLLPTGPSDALRYLALTPRRRRCAGTPEQATSQLKSARRRPVSQRTNQIGQGRDRVILQVTQRFEIAAQEPIQLRGPTGPGGNGVLPPRRIQATLKPKCLAPATSNPLDETNSTSWFFKPSDFSTSA